MNELLTAGIELMLVGMGIVYAFLALLVVAANTMSSIVQRHFPEIPHTTAHHVSVPVSQASPEEANLIAAITAAVHQYRNKHH